MTVLARRKRPMASFLSSLLLFLLISGQAVPVAVGEACWYEHRLTASGYVYDPYEVPIVALKDSGWNREPRWVLARYGDRVAWLLHADTTLSMYAAELSPAACRLLGIEFGREDGVAWGGGQVEIFTLEGR